MKSYWMAVVLIAAPLAAGQSLDLRVLDGLKAKASDVVDVTLNKDMLKLGASFLGSGNDQDSEKFKKLVNGLESLLVKSFEFEKEGAYSHSDLDKVIREMGKPGWNLVVSTTEKRTNETTRIWFKASTEQEPGGMRMICAEAQELTVVELIGRGTFNNLKELAEMAGVHGVTIGQSDKKKEE